MKNFKILIESVQGLLLEANFKPLHKQFQEYYFDMFSKTNYESLSDEDKKDLEHFIKKREVGLKKEFEQFNIKDESTQNWVINVFATDQQDYKTDSDKVMEQVELYLELRRKNKLNKEEKNLNDLKYIDVLFILNKYAVDDKAESDFGNNKIIHEDGEWKIVLFDNYEDTFPFVKGSKSNWCIKHQTNFNHYKPPYYAFYQHNKAYALFHEKSLQLKNIDDFAFGRISDSFEKQISWLIFDHLKIKEFTPQGRNFIGDFRCLLDFNQDKYISLFDKTILLYAIQNDDQGLMVKFLRNPKTDVNGSVGRITPLVYAVEKDNPLMVKYLITHENLKINAKDEDGETALTLTTKLKRQNWYDILDLLLKHKDIDVNAGDKNNMNPLILAVRNVDLRTVNRLLLCPNINVNYQGSNGDTALISLLKYGERRYRDNFKIFESLYAHPNIDINLANNQGETPLSAICHYSSHLGEFRILMKDPKIDVNGKEYTPLIEAIKYSNTTALTELLQHPKINVNGNDNVPLVEAARKKKADYVQRLLNHPNINIYKRNYDGQNAMDIAREINDEDVLRVLYKYEEKHETK